MDQSLFVEKDDDFGCGNLLGFGDDFQFTGYSRV